MSDREKFWFAPGANVRFRRRDREYTGVLEAQWKGRDGYRVRVRMGEGVFVDVDPVADQLEVDV